MTEAETGIVINGIINNMEMATTVRAEMVQNIEKILIIIVRQSERIKRLETLAGMIN